MTDIDQSNNIKVVFIKWISPCQCFTIIYLASRHKNAHNRFHGHHVSLSTTNTTTTINTTTTTMTMTMTMTTTTTRTRSRRRPLSPHQPSRIVCRYINVLCVLLPRDCDEGWLAWGVKIKQAAVSIGYAVPRLHPSLTYIPLCIHF